MPDCYSIPPPHTYTHYSRLEYNHFFPLFLPPKLNDRWQKPDQCGPYKRKHFHPKQTCSPVARLGPQPDEAERDACVCMNESGGAGTTIDTGQEVWGVVIMHLLPKKPWQRVFRTQTGNGRQEIHSDVTNILGK